MRNRLLAFCLFAFLVPSPSAAQPLDPALVERFSQGVAALKEGDLDAAERAFRLILAGGGDRAFVYHNLGIVLQRRGRHAEALEAFQAALKRDPEFGAAHLLAGTSLLALNRPREAAASLERALRYMPDEITAHLQLADAYERLGDTPALVDRYRRIVALVPGEAEYAYRLGKAYLRLSQRSFEQIQAIAPESARLQQALGREYLAQGRADLAARAFAEAARRDPSLEGVHLALARIHADAGRWDEAARELELELAVAPQSRAARELQAQVEAARIKP